MAASKEDGLELIRNKGLVNVSCRKCGWKGHNGRTCQRNVTVMEETDVAPTKHGQQMGPKNSQV